MLTALHRFARTRRLRSDWTFALTLSLVWLVFYNASFWIHTANAMWAPEPARVWFFFSLALLVTFVQAAVLLLLPGATAMRIGAGVLFAVAAAAGHFIDRYGIVINGDMIRNVMQTDVAEAHDLMSLSLIARVLLLGVLPAILVWWIRLPRTSLRDAVKQRAVFIGAGCVLVVLAALPASASYAVFLREYKPIRSQLNPGAAVSASISYASQLAAPVPAQPRDPGGTPHRVDAGSALLVSHEARKPMVLFLVIGETARAANFQLNGYGRETNPALAARHDLAYFANTASCGTSTAASVPCMFSHRGRADFRSADAKAETNLLDMLQKAGLAVEWRDNNAGCKGVCARVPTIDYHANGRVDFDAVMNADLAKRLSSIDSDTVIVFHQMGSHGPAYFERYPREGEFFQPACRSNRLDACSGEAVTNAYDNSIRYTDSVLAAQIAALEAASDRVDAALLYVSDHGESLGEQGVYLHGMPYNFAPGVQKQVPMLFWLSPGMQRRAQVTIDCLRDAAIAGASHDQVFHSVFGLLGVRNAVYREDRDLTAPCRAEGAQRLALLRPEPLRSHSDRAGSP